MAAGCWLRWNCKETRGPARLPSTAPSPTPTPAAPPGFAAAIGNDCAAWNWSRLFKTGYINTDGSVHNVLSGESAVFAIRQPNTLRTAPDYWGNLRNRWTQT
jgi:hypothetical protein